MLKFNDELIAYAGAFASFVIPKVSEVREIVLFGSAARREAGKESDVDIFFNVEKSEDEERIKKILKNEIDKFYKSKIAETFFLKGIKNAIKMYIGKLEEWKLKRSVISDGICLYGKYKETPEKLKGFVLFNITPIKDITKRNRLIRRLFGREEKEYSSSGILKELNGKKLSASSFIAPIENSQKIIKMLGDEKIDFSFFEFWTDQIE